jgi:Dimerisation domain of Zinc Transporter
MDRREASRSVPDHHPAHEAEVVGHGDASQVPPRYRRICSSGPKAKRRTIECRPSAPMMSPSVLRGALEGDLLGAGGFALGWRWADPAVGLVITVVILGVLRSAVTQVSARLMDAVDPALVDRATEALVAVEGVEEVRELRIRWIGHRLRAEADITADPSLTITQGHQLAHQAEDRLLARVCRLSAASAHVSPIEAHQEIEPPRSLSSDA